MGRCTQAPSTAMSDRQACVSSESICHKEATGDVLTASFADRWCCCVLWCVRNVYPPNNTHT